MAFTKIVGAGINTTGNFTFGSVTVNSIQLSDGKPVGGAGLGTAIDGNDQIYYTDTVLSIGSTTTINPPDSSNVAYTQYAEIAVEEGFDLIIEDGDDFVPDILGLSTGTAAPLAGAGGRVRADNFTNKAGTGAPTFPNGVNVTGVATATTFSGNLTGDVTGDVTGNVTGNVTGDVTGNLTGDVTTGVGGNITVGNSFINGTSIGIGTTTTAGRNAGVGTATGTMVYDVDSGLLVYSGSEWQNVKSNFIASGGTLDEGVSRSGYNVHTFTGSGQSFVVSSGSKTVEYLIVGGGGGGGSNSYPVGRAGAGGGAGGLVFGSFEISPGTYPITIGAGGGVLAGNTFPNTPTDYPGGAGNSSTFTGAPISSVGGGGGGTSHTGPEAGNGAVTGPSGVSSGGGNSGGATGATGGTNGSSSPPAGWGNPGGPSFQSGPEGWGAAGGGGAGAAGSNGTSGSGGNGGDGLQYSINGSATYYAGGGGGGCSSGPQGTGGQGGGATATNTNGASPSGTANTGGGGSGNNYPRGNRSGGQGGSGIVIIAYPTS